MSKRDSPDTKRRSLSILASDRGDRLWWGIGQSEKIHFQLFSENRDTFHISNGLRELFPLCAEQLLQNCPERLLCEITPLN